MGDSKQTVSSRHIGTDVDDDRTGGTLTGSSQMGS